MYLSPGFRKKIKELIRYINVKLALCHVIGVIDADHFEVQIYQELQQWKFTIGEPTIVVADKTITSVSPEATRLGITRRDTVYSAKIKCPTLHIIPIEIKFGLKPDYKHHMKRSNELRAAVLRFWEQYKKLGIRIGKEIKIKRTGSDEFYLDLTELVTKIIQKYFSKADFDFEEEFTNIFEEQNLILESFEAPFKDNEFFKRIRNLQISPDGLRKTEFRLAVGGLIMAKLCAFIKEETNLVCSGGVGTTQTLCKLACKYNKPNATTVLTRKGFERIYNKIPFTNIPGLGGELGQSIKNLFGKDFLSICELQKLLRNKAEKSRVTAIVKEFKKDVGKTLKLIMARYNEPVKHKLMYNNVNCGKRHLGTISKSEIKEIANRLAQNMEEKLQQEIVYNGRVPKKIVLKIQTKRGTKSFRVKYWDNQQEQIVTKQLSTVVSDALRDPFFDNAINVEYINFKGSDFERCPLAVLFALPCARKKSFRDCGKYWSEVLPHLHPTHADSYSPANLQKLYDLDSHFDFAYRTNPETYLETL